MQKTAFTLALILLAGTATAQDTYIGVSVDYGTNTAQSDQTVASLMAGGSFDLGQMAIGAEIEYGAAATLGGDYDTLRVRAIGSYDLGSFSAMASLGSTRFSTSADNYSGYNLGLGVQMPVSDTIELRGEVIRDFVDGFGADTSTTRIAAIYSF